MPESPGTFQSDTSPLRRVLLKHARTAFVDQRSVDRQWEALHYLERPDFAGACREYDAFSGLLESLGVAVAWVPPEDVGLDSMYVRDASVVCDGGAILCSMGKEARRGEPAALGRVYEALGIPLRGRIEGGGRLEGGDVVWLRPGVLAVGRGYRTNDEGIRQLTELLAGCADEVVRVPLPHWNGHADVFHLMSMVSPVADDLALVYSPLLPVPFRERLLDMGMELVEVPDEEFDTLGCNVLAVGPRRVVAAAGSPQTRRRLEAAGVEVHVYQGAEISLKGSGGPTCLTRPLDRMEA